MSDKTNESDERFISQFTEKVKHDPKSQKMLLTAIFMREWGADMGRLAKVLEIAKADDRAQHSSKRREKVLLSLCITPRLASLQMPDEADKLLVAMVGKVDKALPGKELMRRAETIKQFVPVFDSLYRAHAHEAGHALLGRAFGCMTNVTIPFHLVNNEDDDNLTYGLGLKTATCHTKRFTKLTNVQSAAVALGGGMLEALSGAGTLAYLAESLDNHQFWLDMFDGIGEDDEHPLGSDVAAFNEAAPDEKSRHAAVKLCVDTMRPHLTGEHSKLLANVYETTLAQFGQVAQSAQRLFLLCDGLMEMRHTDYAPHYFNGVDE